MAELTIHLRGLSRKQLLVAGAGLALSTALAATAITYIRQHTTLAGLPRDAYENLSFPVFFPKNPPRQFTLDRGSISSKPEVLGYKFDYDKNKPVYVSIQPLDPNLDTNSFRPTRTIGTGIGQGYLAEFQERTTIAIMAGKSFVIINAPQQVSAPAIEQFADSLREVK